MTWNQKSPSAGPPGTGTVPKEPIKAGVGQSPGKPIPWAGDHLGIEGSIRVLEPGRMLNQEGVQTQAPASRIEVLALDEFVASASGTVTVESDPLISDIVGMYDQIAIQVVTDSVLNGAMASPLLKCDMYHSADGINWIKKQVSTSEIPHFPLSLTSTTYVPLGYDPGTSPSLAFLKLITTITGTNFLSAHVNIRLTCNDARELHFARQLAREYKRAHKDLPEDYWLPFSSRVKKCEKEMTPPDPYRGVADCIAMGIPKSWVDQQAESIAEAIAGARATSSTSGLPKAPKPC
jgi:hypothetical protein